MTPLPALGFPFGELPAFGEVKEIADGLLWVRIPLPYVLDHVNIYLLEDGGGWAVIDTGTNTPEAIAVWEALFSGPLSGMKISRVVVTHFHPDHMGLAGWFQKVHGTHLLTSPGSHALGRLFSQRRSEEAIRQNFDFFLRHGLSAETAGLIALHDEEYPKHVAPVPPDFERIVQGDTLTIGARTFRVLTGDGHAPEQVMLHSAEEGLFFAADQVMERITPNVGIEAAEPTSDPLGHFLGSLRRIADEVPGDVLVLPGHHRPFTGLATRCHELILHHQERCDLILAACARRPHSAADLVPLLFQRELDAHQMWFAVTETLAHANRLIRRSELAVIDQSDRSLLTLP